MTFSCLVHMETYILTHRFEVLNWITSSGFIRICSQKEMLIHLWAASWTQKPFPGVLWKPDCYLQFADSLPSQLWFGIFVMLASSGQVPRKIVMEHARLVIQAFSKCPVKLVWCVPVGKQHGKASDLGWLFCAGCSTWQTIATKPKSEFISCLKFKFIWTWLSTSQLSPASLKQ